MNSISDVYNMKVAETTQRIVSLNALTPSNEDHFRTTITFLEQVRTTYNHIHQTNSAGLVTLFYSLGAWYSRLETALGNVTNSYPFPVPFVASYTNLDDLLFSGGYTFDIHENTKVTAAGLFGIPAHRDVGLLGAQFGTGRVGLGVQLDASYAYSKNRDHVLLGAIRYIHLISRESPALDSQELNLFDLSSSNAIDFLYALHNSWGKHQWEIGYNATFSFGARIRSAIVDIYQPVQFIRSSFYTTYAYTFAIRKHESGMSIGFSYGADHVPDDTGYKHMGAGWFTWGMDF